MSGTETGSSSIAFPRNLLNFNVTLIGTNGNFGIFGDNSTLDKTRELLEEFLLESYLNRTAPVFNLTLKQENQFELFPGSLIRNFEYSGRLFVWHLESSWNTRKVQRYQVTLLNEKEKDVEELLNGQRISLLVDDISVAPLDYSYNTADEDGRLQQQTTSNGKPKDKYESMTTGSTIIVVSSIAFVAALVFGIFILRKSSQVRANRASELEKHRRRDVEESIEDVLSDSTMQSM